jgi:tetratricopeptide (TPR) repeat protein/tRNA A-37 threonylcarbamoyl transferase component Bud32
MDDDLQLRAEILVTRMRSLPKGERPAVVKQACGGNTALFDLVNLMMASAGPEEAVPELQGTEDVTVADAVGERPGDKIGRFRLLERIGEGGFGVVFTAEQQAPVRRRVAIKVIKLGMDTREVVARFDAERQALAMMDHPGIAKVFDAGSTESGRPYFVMELVRGCSVTEYADKHRLGTAARVALVAQVCRAVQHAHGKGVIHRDIKPSNVLVTVTDDKPVPKVIDFGIAKATQSKLTERTLYTAHRQLIGTPQYMSPEQADSDGSDIDTRTDVYSLGVMLYELLIGTTPRDAWVLRSAAFDEMRKLIRETDVPHPSTRLLTMSNPVLQMIAANRSTDLKQLRQSVKGELDWIVMKALERDRSRRYETAAAMADDLSRYLEGDAVMAGPVGHLYRLQKVVHRNRTAFSAAAAIAVVLMVAVGATTWGLVRESRLRALAVASEQKAVAAEKKATDQTGVAITERNDAQRQRAAALAAEADALQQKKLSDAVVGFLTETFGRASPENTRDDRVSQVLVQSLIEPALKTIDQRFEGQPLIRATVQQTLARTLSELGRFDLALPQAKAAWDARLAVLGADDPGTIDAMIGYCELLNASGRYQESADLSNQALDTARRALGPSNPACASAMNSYGNALFHLGNQAKAADVFKQAWDLRRHVQGDENTDTITMMMNYGVALESLGRHAEAAEVEKQVWDHRRRMQGDDHPETIRAMNNYANDLIGLGQYSEAAALLKKAWQTARSVEGDDHPDTIQSLANYGAALLGQSLYDQAAEACKQAWESGQRVLGNDHLETIGALVNYCIALDHLARQSEAEPLLRQAADTLRRIRPDHPFRGIALTNLGKCLIAEHKWADAEPALRENWSWDLSHANGPASTRKQQSLQLLNECLRAMGKPPEPTTVPATQMSEHSPQDSTGQKPQI